VTATGTPSVIRHTNQLIENPFPKYHSSLEWMASLLCFWVASAWERHLARLSDWRATCWGFVSIGMLRQGSTAWTTGRGPRRGGRQPRGNPKGARRWRPGPFWRQHDADSLKKSHSWGACRIGPIWYGPFRTRVVSRWFGRWGFIVFAFAQIMNLVTL